MNVFAISDRVARWAARGLQTRRKDKDLMADTGGVSKTRPREPDVKPPREDTRQRYRHKELTPEERDRDVVASVILATAAEKRLKGF